MRHITGEGRKLEVQGERVSREPHPDQREAKE
jgi:hypothetical protein